MAFKTLFSHYKHFKKFGLTGNRLLLNARKPKGEIISITLPNFRQPIYLRAQTSDIETFHKIFYNTEYNVPINFKPEVILDLGANIGLATVFFSNKYPDAKIFSVEPEKANFEMLLKNTQFNPNITCLNYGIWNRSTNLEIKSGYDNWGFRVNEVDYENENTVAAISINKILEDYKLDHIDILKIDIEGSEKELFEKNIEKWLPKTKMIVIELHDEIKAGCSKSMFKALCNYNFDLSVIGENYVCKLLN